MSMVLFARQASYLCCCGGGSVVAVYRTRWYSLLTGQGPVCVYLSSYYVVVVIVIVVVVYRTRPPLFVCV